MLHTVSLRLIPHRRFFRGPETPAGVAPHLALLCPCYNGSKRRTIVDTSQETRRSPADSRDFVGFRAFNAIPGSERSHYTIQIHLPAR
jgi:hypothetical protein